MITFIPSSGEDWGREANHIMVVVEAVPNTVIFTVDFSIVREAANSGAVKVWLRLHQHKV